MEKSEKLALIRETGVIAVMRAKSSTQLIRASDAIKAGGVRVIEVTMTTPGALDVIRDAKDRYAEGTLFGAGSVLDVETARAAILAGADFIVGPALNLPVIALCNRYSVPVIPGCLTPTEIISAWEAGASMIKLFPASIGGPDFIKAILAPLPQVEIVPVGGIELSNAAEFIRAGGVALGVGSSLINDKLLNAGDFSELTSRAADFIEKVQEGRAQTR